MAEINYLLDLEGAKRARDAAAAKEAKRAKRKRNISELAIKAGIVVQVLPYMGKPPELTKRQEKRQRKAALVRSLQDEVARLRKTKARPLYKQGMGKEFYDTREWREIRWSVLTASDGKCLVCNRGRDDGVILHVDHIKPRSKFPALELVFDNLQVLCEDCNIGKSNR